MPDEDISDFTAWLFWASALAAAVRICVLLSARRPGRAIVEVALLLTAWRCIGLVVA
jgi:hypothetical protein